MDIAGKEFVPTVLHVVEKHSDGSPKRFELVRHDESVDVRSGTEQFWIVYAPPAMSRRNQ